jgi:hypothetical protein
MARQSSPATRLRRSGAAIVALAALGAWSAPGSASAADGDRLRIDFEQGDPLTAGTRVTDVSGYGNHGVVESAYGGQIADRPGFAKFLTNCDGDGCPNAMIEIDDAASLDPGFAPFEWGAAIKLRSDETADGENIVQKGRWGDNGGQWKLQVDKEAGKPSCVVSGVRNGASDRVVVKASVGIADGTWHSVVCRRTNAGVAILVDGAERGSAAMEPVELDSPASVTIGAKDIKSQDNDQFQGRLDDVFMRLI